MNDFDKLLREAPSVQSETSAEIEPQLPRIWPWAILAGLLILASVCIHIFWPAPAHKHMALCKKGLTEHCYKIDPTAEN
ncbi:hypothetical protein JK203_13540 [Gluconobacter cerinus]|uniref:hypothetical protein n=1 Tax=Gluconobacter cerinus TaxID=38307 RepID=UPI00062C95A4|nr:hypothetical protein [Gluconobacter cerinus]MBS1041858.1 hypothetical protein [Gluconobacter cerinus]MBS1048446.1 hypothetical protein [Gluconobacter cerinus]MBS1069692.1 hypothetical protein [Gluconobacter cerinus]OUJ08439.1 hypothetical protein HK24_08065 [Gluconobacter sp. DsW_058]